eukprot:TRINITY_DN61232_c0_g1_i1.p1 TRINITY_DN61232_c0_g1~~TRINITY_DN61232_c0_g1_i1.p1  ORF type:complete len:294 (+),score=78.64 TRINITY_DN61232_c0_g1_i1:92-973(+)
MALEVASVYADVARDVAAGVDWWEVARAMASPTAPLIPTAVFLGVKAMLRPVSPEFHRDVLKPFLRVYDAVMSLFSFACFVSMALALMEVGPYPADCDAAYNNDRFRWTVYAFYFSKYAEYIDSWALVLAGKQCSWLQIFHHVGAPWSLWFGNYGRSAGAWTFCLLNSFVHTIMYAYYLATSFGWRTRLKPLITVMQMTQFLVAFFLAWPLKDVPCHRADPKRMLAWIFCYLYVGGVFVFFINFSLWAYVFRKPKRRSEPLAGQERPQSAAGAAVAPGAPVQRRARRETTEEP